MAISKTKPRVKTFGKVNILHTINADFERQHGIPNRYKISDITLLFDAVRVLLMTADPVCRIEIRDFGVFEVKKTAAKPKARNLKTGEFVFVPARRKMHFKAGIILKTFLKKPVK